MQSWILRMRNTVRYLLIGTVIITAGLTTATYNACADGFLSGLFGSSKNKEKPKGTKEKSKVKDVDKTTTDEEDSGAETAVESDAEEEKDSKKKKDSKSKDKEKKIKNNKEDKNETKSKEEKGKGIPPIKKKFAEDGVESKNTDEKEGANIASTSEEGSDEETAVSIDEEKEKKEKEKADDEFETVEDEKIAIKFKDGTKIEKSAILKDLYDVGMQYQNKMSFNDLMLLIELRHAYEKVITDAAKKAKMDQDEKYKQSLEARKKALGTFAFLEDQAEKLMTKKELKKFYDDTWDKHIKGTDQVSLVLIQAPDKKTADQIKRDAKNEESLNKIIKDLKDRGNNVATIPLDDYPETSLPPEIIKEMKSKGKNTVVGPFPMQGVVTLLFLKSFHKAKKKELSDDMIPQVKQLASKEFANRYVSSLIKKYKVEIYDLNGDKMEWDSKDKKDKKKKQVPMLSKIKETQVIARIGDQQELTMQDLYKMFNIKSLDNEIFGSLAMQLRISIEDVIYNAIKLCVQDKLLAEEVEKAEYMKTSKMKKLCEQIEKQHLRNAYFANTVKITESDAKKEYNKYIKMMKPEDKDDNEISVKLLFYKTEKETETAIKEYKGKPKQFNEDFKTKLASNKDAIDLGYVKRQEVPQEVWKIIKTSTPGTCINKVLQIDGAAYGFEGKNFAVAYIGDRRPIKLPTFQETAPMFRKVAEKMQAIAICDKLLLDNVIRIDGKTYKSLQEEMRHKLLVIVIQGDSSTTPARN